MTLGRHILRWAWSIKGTDGRFAKYTAILGNEFVWWSDQQGVMNVEGTFDLNAIYDIGLVGMCSGYSEARLRVTPLIFVSQSISGSSELVLDSANYSNSYLNIKSKAGCVGIVDDGMATRLDTGEVTLTRSNFPLQTDRPVLVTTALLVQAYAYNGASVELDFVGAPSLGWDVPCVALVINL